MIRFVNNYLFMILILVFVLCATNTNAQFMSFSKSAIPETGIPKKGDKFFFSATDSQNTPLIVRKAKPKPEENQKKSWILRPSKDNTSIKIGKNDTLKVVLKKQMDGFWKPTQKYRNARLTETLIQDNDMVFVFNFTKQATAERLFFYNISNHQVENIKKISVKVK